MNTLKELSELLIWLIRVGASIRVSYCFIKMIHSEEIEVYKKRIKNTIVFYVLAESVWQLKYIAMYYFK